MRSVEDDIQILVKQYKSEFFANVVCPGIHTFKDVSEKVSRAFKKEIEIRGRIQPHIKYDRSSSML